MWLCVISSTGIGFSPKMRLLAVILLSAEIFLKSCQCADYIATLSHNGPVILGANISFKVAVFNSDGELSNERFKFLWKDDAIPHHEGETFAENGESYWNTSYPAGKSYVPGQYEVQVTVQVWRVIVYWTVTSQRTKFDVTAKLNGELKISQGGVNRKGPYISNIGEALHEVVLSPPDKEYLSTAPQVLSYWYVDCVYYGQSEGYNFLFNYTQEDQERTVEVLVVASFEPPPTPEPTTTTTTTTPAPTTTTTLSPGGNNVTTELTSTSSTTLSTLSDASNLLTSATKATPVVLSTVNGIGGLDKKPTLIQGSGEFVPYICMNSSVIPSDPKKIYGYFSRQLKIKAPVANVNVNGTFWLPRGDVIHLQVNCLGSSPYTHCVQIMPGLYNVTGNETCRQAEKITDSMCDFNFQRYLSVVSTYTAIIIINNYVNTNVTSVAINIYEVTKKAQLSVIVVPVVCTILAVILMIFGVAYYVQNRRRFVVEVADFHFGHTDVDMECKTFQERLREAIVNAFSRSIIDDDSDSESCDSGKRTGRGMWPRRGFGNAAGPNSSGSGGPGNSGSRGDPRSQKYGSME